MLPIRSWLFVPGNQPRMIEKVADLAADAVIFDLEDSVPDGEKSSARDCVSAALTSHTKREGRATLAVRASGAGVESLEADLDIVAQSNLDVILLPKVESVGELQAAAACVARHEKRLGLVPGQIRVLASIETSRGLLDAARIAAASDRLAALMFGAEDFALDLGIAEGGNADPMLYARSAIAVAAASCRLACIDRVVTDFRNDGFLAADCRQARALGFSGKAVIHPRQIDVVNRQFAPTPKEIENAEQILDAYQRASAAGHGVTSLGGEMIDLPVVDRARQILRIRDSLENRD